MDGFQGFREDEIKINIYINLHFLYVYMCETTKYHCKVVFMSIFLGKGVHSFHQILKRIRDSKKC